MPQHATLRGTLAPGDHARLNVASRAEANPRSGTCSFTSVNLEPPSQARFTTTDVPVHLYVQDSFPRKGTFVDPAGKHDGGGPGLHGDGRHVDRDALLRYPFTTPSTAAGVSGQLQAA